MWTIKFDRKLKESKNTLFNFVSYSIPENLEQSKGEAIATIKSFDCLTRNLFVTQNEEFKYESR